MLIYSTIADTCYTDFTKMTGTIIKIVAVTVSATECAFQCQIISSENFKLIPFHIAKNRLDFRKISFLISETFISFLIL